MAKRKTGCHIAIKVPLGPPRPAENYRPRHVEIGGLSPAQGDALYRLREGLRAQHAELPGGKPVHTNPDTIRWLLERIANTGGTTSESTRTSKEDN